MEDLTVYEQTVTISLLQEDGSMVTGTLPHAALADQTFLGTWLHGKSEKTQIAYLSAMEKLYKHSKKSLREFTLSDFQAFTDSLIGLKVATRTRIIATVKSALSFGEKEGYLPLNVGAVVKLPKQEDMLAERIVSEQHIARMFALETNPRNHAILVLLYRAGLRVSELCNLQWRHMQERSETGQVTVFGKGKKTRHILLDDHTWQEVMQLHSSLDTNADYVFRSRQSASRANKQDRRMEESTVHRIVKTAANRAGVTDKFSPHWFRHAHATHALERGAPITLVQATLGHKSMETTAKYTHVRPNASSSQFLGV